MYAWVYCNRSSKPFSRIICRIVRSMLQFWFYDNVQKLMTIFFTSVRSLRFIDRRMKIETEDQHTKKMFRICKQRTLNCILRGESSYILLQMLSVDCVFVFGCLYNLQNYIQDDRNWSNKNNSKRLRYIFK